MEDTCYLAVREAENMGAEYAEAFMTENKGSEVLIENNDLKQLKYHKNIGLGIRVFIGNSLGFSSVNSSDREHVKDAVIKAIKLARISPADKYNSVPKNSKIKFLEDIYDINAESFTLYDATKMASDMLSAAKSFDDRVSIDSGNFTNSVTTHVLLNSTGTRAEETVTSFSWLIMGMAINDKEVSNFDFRFGGTHHVRDIDVFSTGREFAKTVVNSLGPRKIASFRGKMLLTPPAATELIQDVIAYSINSYMVQKGASKFGGKIGKYVSSDLLTLEDNATDVSSLTAASFDREGVPHRRNIIIENGILTKFIYNTYTANKDNTESSGNAGGSPKIPPMVSATNIIINPGKQKLEDLISEMDRGIIVNRFSGNVNPANGDFSGVVKGGHYIKKGNNEYPVKEVMVAGNIFDALYDLVGISKERKVLADSILPYMLFDNISFTAG